MDVDAFVATRSGDWARLEALVKHRRRLRGQDADELVALYQATTTDLSLLRSAAPDAALVARLSRLVARARDTVAGPSAPAWSAVARFLAVTFPAAAYRVRWWALGTAAASLAVAGALGVWVARTPAVQASIAAPPALRDLVDHQFASYYADHPATDFAAQVWTHNAFIAALCIASGALLGLPVLYLLAENAANLGVVAGLVIGHGRAGLFFSLILPHGLLELTVVFLAAAVGLRLGWTVVDPGPRTRSAAMAQEGRAAGVMAIGLAGLLGVSGMIEAFVTPAPWPWWARVGLGVVVWLGVLTWLGVAGRRAVAAGEHGDLAADQGATALPTSA